MSCEFDAGHFPSNDIEITLIFDKNLKSITADLGRKRIAKTAYVTEKTGIAFRPSKAAIEAAAESLIEYGVVKPPT